MVVIQQLQQPQVHFQIYQIEREQNILCPLKIEIKIIGHSLEARHQMEDQIQELTGQIFTL